MKHYLTVLAAALIGALVGAFAASLYISRAMFPIGIHAIEDRQEATCAISLGVLKQLEEGNTDRAKLFLAREVAFYYHYPFTQTALPRRNEMLHHIETLRPKSTILNQEISKMDK